MGMLENSVKRWPDGELIFTFIGLLTEEKGIFDIVEIARLLRDRKRHFRLYIVGEGLPDEITRLRERILRYNLSEFVHLTGVLVGAQKFKLLQKTTIFLFPSYFRAETQSTVLMEALSVGVPVVAYDWRGISTIIDQGVNGYLAPLRNTEAFCQAIERILSTAPLIACASPLAAFFSSDLRIEKHIEALGQAFQSLDFEVTTSGKVQAESA